MSKTRRPRSANLRISLHIRIMPMINVNPSGERMHSSHPRVILAHDSLSKWHMMVMVLSGRRRSMLLPLPLLLLLYYFRLIRMVIVIIMGGVDHVLIIRIIHGFSSSTDYSIAIAIASCYSFTDGT